MDRPFEQRRDPLSVDLSGGGGHVVGGRRPAERQEHRCCALIVASLALTHTPREVQFYCLDFGGGSLGALRGLPHVGGVASRLDADQVRRTVAEVQALLDQRERVFAEHGIDSIATYRRPARQGRLADDAFGDVFLVVDGWPTLRSDFEDLEPIVTDLATRGLATASTSGRRRNRWMDFRPAVRDLFGTRLELRLGDPSDSMIGPAQPR